VLLPKPSGDWGVGRRLLQWVDSSRLEPTDSSHFRTLPVWVWYPTAKSTAQQVNVSLPGQWTLEQDKFLEKKIGTAASQFLASLQSWSVPDAPVAPTKEKLPVLIFGPGLTWVPQDYSFIIEDIVSHGYIVIGYVPTGFAGITQLADGKMVVGSLDVAQQNILFDDAVFVKNYVPHLAKNWLKDIIDVTTIGVFGHSLGGEAALVTAAKDSSVKALVDLDGDLMGSAVAMRILQPSLFLSHDERDAITDAVKKMDKEGRERSEYRRHADWVKATDGASISLRIRIDDTRHLNFTNLGFIPVSKMTDEERRDKIGNADGNASLKTIANITRDFFDYCLKHAGFYTMVSLEQKYPQAQALLWKGISYN
jgi:hypothetical protein